MDGQTWPSLLVLAASLPAAVVAVNRALGWRAVIEGAEDGVLIPCQHPADLAGAPGVYRSLGEGFVPVEPPARRGRLRDNPWVQSSLERSHRSGQEARRAGGHRLTVTFEPDAWAELRALASRQALTYKQVLTLLLTGRDPRTVAGGGGRTTSPVEELHA